IYRFRGLRSRMGLRVLSFFGIRKYREYTPVPCCDMGTISIASLSYRDCTSCFSRIVCSGESVRMRWT
ncbi:hypothetical protein NDU88_006079, partial [Pleurodeles waltl]